MQRHPANGRRDVCGATLIELVVSIVVISVALAGVLLVITKTTSTSADPMIQRQAVAIAEAYLEEILAKDFAVGPGNTRPTFDDVNDYAGLNQVPTDQTGSPIAGLELYNVSVGVSNQALNGIAAANALLVTVTVTGPGNVSYVLSGYRTNY